MSNVLPVALAFQIVRRSHGWSQAQMGAAVGVSASLIGHIETGRRKPSLTTLEKLTEAGDFALPIFLTALLWDGLTDTQKGLLAPIVVDAMLSTSPTAGTMLRAAGALAGAVADAGRFGGAEEG